MAMPDADPANIMNGETLDLETLDLETVGSGRADKRDLRLWLRLLTCTTLIEAHVRRQLRQEFAATLPRFDLMAQLERADDGMALGELSRRMMVSNGNVTGLVERLVAQGQVERAQDKRDRRAVTVRLTQEGRDAFAEMAQAHEGWIAGAFAGLAPGDAAVMMDVLGRLKASARQVAQ